MCNERSVVSLCFSILIIILYQKYNLLSKLIIVGIQKPIVLRKNVKIKSKNSILKNARLIRITKFISTDKNTKWTENRRAPISNNIG